MSLVRTSLGEPRAEPGRWTPTVQLDKLTPIDPCQPRTGPATPTASSVFGAASERAVKNAQTWENAVSNAGLVVDGVYGNNTRRAITWPLYTSSGNLDAAHVCRYVSWG